MRLFRLLLQANTGTVVLGVLVGVVSGAANIGLLATIHSVWEGGEVDSARWVGRFAGLLILLIASGVGSQLIALHIALKAMVDLRMDLSCRILASPLPHLEQLGAPRLLAVLTDDVNTLSRSLPNVPRAVIDLTTLAAGVLWLAWLSWKALLMLLVCVLVGLVVYFATVRIALVHMRAGRELFDTIFDNFRALLDGIKQLKLNWQRRASFLEEDLRPSVEAYRRRNIAGRVRLIAADNLTRLSFFVLLGLVVFVLPRLSDIGSTVVNGYILMALFLYRPLGSMMTLVPEFGRAAVSASKIERMGLTLARDPGSPRAARPQAPPWESLRMEGVTFTYHAENQDRPFTVGPIDVGFRPGEVVFLVGGNGSGKTTLAKVLTTLYPAESGRILVDRQEVTPENQEGYRQLFSVIFSDFHLFGSLVDGGKGDLDALAKRYLEEFELDHKVEVKQGNFSTTALSLGQRKRLALLAAYLEDRPFYIFDEWAADQDPRFKRVFYTQILPALRSRGKTVLVITHDERFFDVADRCLRLADGKLEAREPPAP